MSSRTASIASLALLADSLSDSATAILLPSTVTGQRLSELILDDPSGETGTISPEAAETAVKILDLILDQQRTAPAIFPGENGAAQLVWSLEGTRTTIEILGADLITGQILNRFNVTRNKFRWSSVEEMALYLSEFCGKRLEYRHFLYLNW